MNPIVGFVDFLYISNEFHRSGKKKTQEVSEIHEDTVEEKD